MLLICSSVALSEVGRLLKSPWLTNPTLIKTGCVSPGLECAVWLPTFWAGMQQATGVNHCFLCFVQKQKGQTKRTSETIDQTKKTHARFLSDQVICRNCPSRFGQRLHSAKPKGIRSTQHRHRPRPCRWVARHLRALRIFRRAGVGPEIQRPVGLQ